MTTPPTSPPTRELRPLVLTPVTLEGHGVRLEPLGLHHVDGLWALRDVEAFRYLTDRIDSRDAMAAYVERALAMQRAGTAQPFAVVRTGADGDVLAGTTRYYDAHAHNRGLTIGYTWLGPAFWRSHVNTAAKYLLLRHAFEALGAIRVAFTIDSRNARSRAAVERLGARLEGTLRHHMLLPGGVVRDTCVYALLDTDWPTVRPGLEAALLRRTAASTP